MAEGLRTLRSAQRVTHTAKSFEEARRVTRMRLSLPAVASSTRAARDFLQRLEGSIPSAVLADMRLAADELVAQWLLVQPPVSETLTFEIDVGRDEVTIAVEHGTDPFGPRPVTAGDAAALGLAVVDEVSDRWGIEEKGGVTRAWATFAVSVSRR
jgi:hypothetical protein